MKLMEWNLKYQKYKRNENTLPNKNWTMRKLIDIPEDVKVKLQIKAVKAGKDLKNFIQQILIDYAKDNKKWSVFT